MKKLLSGLTRIFHTSHSEATEKADGTRKAMNSDQGCMCTYCPTQNSSLTQYPSALAKLQTERYEISCLNTTEKRKGRSFFYGALFIGMMISRCLSASESHHQSIRIPLGLAWGDLPQSLEVMAKPGGFTIVHKEEVGDKTILTVHGLLGTALEETLFIYKKNVLVEIEYRYGNPSWKKENYEAFFNSFRRMYDEKYGSGNLLTQTISKKNNLSEMNHSLLGYEWSQAACNLDLFLFSAETSLHSYYLVSLHYKAP